ncbi:M56 family metallopeptidase [Streptomyces sp. NBC_00536]|uniref:M56 family metallopeptidase n=1 Tax=Streptomyces sp. NBC_00536 TaxID=2975769 RepID=UPI002E80CF81|nr:M56 family metallopeptidase [Streptomyces sp. NBC_00536]WUC77872.1 M56 family metallopeptidase [Streptomyces sp. NBC_00536]
MIYAVWLPLLVPFLAGPVGHRLAACLPPRQAAWLLTVAAAGLALGSSVALALLVVPGATHLRVVAVLGRLLTPLRTGSPDAVVAVAVVAAALLAWSVARLVRGANRRWAQVRRAGRLAAHAHGELVVLDEPGPDAYALPGSPGRIVVTTGMLHALSAAEREALFAHERAHLRERHHLFAAVVDLAALCHPALRALREPLAYALERSADEAAARATGDRGLTARAIGRAALAARAAGTPGPARPAFALAATAGPVPRRVAALLGRPVEAAPAPRTRTARRLTAAALLACLVLSGAAALDAARDLHAGIEAAQGESAGK